MLWKDEFASTVDPIDDHGRLPRKLVVFCVRLPLSANLFNRRTVTGSHPSMDWKPLLIHIGLSGRLTCL